MAQQLTIKQIAQLAGVSAGTVDRVLHNRGKVSPEALKAVRSVLSSQNYKYNLHTSAVAFRKTKKSIKLIISIPSSEKGEYWDLIRTGIEAALSEYNDFDIESKYVYFNQFDAVSCHTAFDSICDEPCSAVILSTQYVHETRDLCSQLDKRGVPYALVDGSVEGTSPIACFKADQQVCGRLLARLLDGFTPKEMELALMLPRRTGTLMSNNSAIRMAAFKEYFAEKGKARTIHEVQFPVSNAEEINADVAAFLKNNPKVSGIAVVISHSYVISDALKACGIKGIVVGGFDVTAGNARCVREGTLDILIDQHPERQGFYAVESMLHYLLYGIPDVTLKENLPLDIVLKENLP